MNTFLSRTMTIASCLLFSCLTAGADSTFDVRDYGAKPGEKSLCTAAVQKAIDACASAGGGRVYFPPGVFRSGTLYLKNNTTLWLEAGCTLQGSPDGKDYPSNPPAIRSYTDNYVTQSLIAGEGLQNVGICGRGTIDGSGGAFHWPKYLNRPYVIRLVGCRDVRVEGVRLQSSPMWMQHYLACDRVRLRDVTVFNHGGYNNDGVDIDGCHDVSISGCIIDSDDDALCLKSTLDRPCRNVTVSNCILSSHCNAFKLGTESNGGFENITVANCTISSPRESRPIYGVRPGMGGIALETVDGGTIDRVTVTNITIDGVVTPIFVRLGNRARPFAKGGPTPAVGVLRNVLLSKIIATGAGPIGCSITGIPGHCVENVALDDIHLSFAGGGEKQLASAQVPEVEAKYPESKMFGKLPAYGFYCRHVRGLNLRNMHLATITPDQRHALVCDDVHDLVVDNLAARGDPAAPSLIRLNQVQSAVLRGCNISAPVGTFLGLQGAATKRIALVGNVLTGVSRVADIAADVPKDALVEVSGVGAGKP